MYLLCRLLGVRLHAGVTRGHGCLGPRDPSGALVAGPARVTSQVSQVIEMFSPGGSNSGLE